VRTRCNKIRVEVDDEEHGLLIDKGETNSHRDQGQGPLMVMGLRNEHDTNTYLFTYVMSICPSGVQSNMMISGPEFLYLGDATVTSWLNGWILQYPAWFRQFVFRDA